MKFSIYFDRVFPQSSDKVWFALTEQPALSRWLMNNNLQPKSSHKFSMWCNNSSNVVDIYECKLLIYNPGERMLWSCILAREPDDEMYIEVQTDRVGKGTKVLITHSGHSNAVLIDQWKIDWPIKLNALGELLYSMEKD